jgi:hypothetical protein
MNEALVREFADAGVDELVLSAESSDLDGVRRKLAHNAPEVLGVRPAMWRQA